MHLKIHEVKSSRNPYGAPACLGSIEAARRSGFSKGSSPSSAWRRHSIHILEAGTGSRRGTQPVPERNGKVESLFKGKRGGTLRPLSASTPSLLIVPR